MTELSTGPTLWAISDLHVAHVGNREKLDELVPEHPGDWLIVAGDVAERTDDIIGTLELLKARYATVLWVPGNHELWTTPKDPIQLVGEAKYDYLVERCRELGVLTPEDPPPLWQGQDGPAWVVPLFVPYDYTWRPNPQHTAAEALAVARAHSVVASDEFFITPEPWGNMAAWCRQRVKVSEARLERLDPAYPTVLINHWPLLRAPTRVLVNEDFSLWCGTDLTAKWHREHRASCCVYGHLHIPRTSYYDGVRFEEVSLGYPREWRRLGTTRPLARRILPDPGEVQVGWRRGDNGEMEIYGLAIPGGSIRPSRVVGRARPRSGRGAQAPTAPAPAAPEQGEAE